MGTSKDLRILLADNAAGTTNAISFAARNCDLIGNQRFGRDDGKRGTRKQFACGARVLGEDVAGGFDLYPTAAQLDWIIQRFMGNNIATYPAAAASAQETLHPIYGFVDKGPSNFRYDLLHFSSIIFSFREGDYLNVRLNFVGSAEAGDVTWPVGAPAIDCDSEYVSSDVVFTYDSDPYAFKTLDLTVDNGILPGQQENALNRTIFEADDFMVDLNGTFGYRTDTKALYRQAIAGAAASIAMDDGNDVYTFSFGNLKLPGEGPKMPDSGETIMSLAMKAYSVFDPAAEQLSIAKS